MLRTFLATALVTVIALTSTACSTLDAVANIEPWVKPYERDHLADPIMSFDRTPLATEYLAHVYGVREGSRGGQGGSGGGCGCN
ncbi:MAG: DUF4266 domain-containing protein [Spongiibacteraceae bacterium]